MKANNEKLTQSKTTGNSLSAAEYMQLIDLSSKLIAFLNSDGFAIGENADNEYGIDGNRFWVYDQASPDYGYSGGANRMSLGDNSKVTGWRCMAIGSYALAGNLSATSVGVGAMAMGTHSVAIGRGAVAVKQNSIVIGSHTSRDMWIGASQANWIEDYGTPITVGGLDDVSGVEVRLRGRDSGDLRETPDPLIINKDGGHLGLCSGVGTGSGQGGEVRFNTAPSAAVGSNTQLPLIAAGKFDSASSVDTRFMLLDLTDGTMKRVQFGADDSAGAGFKTLKVAN